MKRWLALLLVVTAAPMVLAQTTIDRVVAVVNKKVITQGEWDVQERFEALVNGKSPDSIEFTAASLDRLVDQVLMREQIDYVRFEALTPQQIATQVAEARKQIAGDEGDAAWQARLAKYALTEEDFAERVAAQMEVMRFVEMRFRPSVHVESDQVETYYKKNLVPELLKAGSSQEALPQLKDVEPKIRGILSEEKLNEMLRMWLTSLRSQGRVKRMLAETKSPTPSGN